MSRILLAVGLAVLGVGHVLFGFANFGFVETLPDDLNVAAEGTGALVVGLALLWSAARALRGTAITWRMLLLAGGLFVATMIVSIATGASDPPMLLVSLAAPLVALIGLSVTGRRKKPTMEHVVEEA